MRVMVKKIVMYSEKVKYHIDTQASLNKKRITKFEILKNSLNDP